MRLALIKDGVVTNITQTPDDWQDKWTPPDGVTVVESDIAGVGDLYDGSTFSRDEGRLATATREALIQQFRAEAVRRIGFQVPAWGTLEAVQLIVSIANMLNTGAMTTAQQAARNIYLYAKNTAIPKLGTLTLAQLEQVDPTAAKPFLAVDAVDAGWPV